MADGVEQVLREVVSGYGAAGPTGGRAVRVDVVRPQQETLFEADLGDGQPEGAEGRGEP